MGTLASTSSALKNDCFLWENGVNAFTKNCFVFLFFFFSRNGLSWLVPSGYCSLKTKQLKKRKRFASR